MNVSVCSYDIEYIFFKPLLTVTGVDGLPGHRALPLVDMGQEHDPVDALIQHPDTEARTA